MKKKFNWDIEIGESYYNHDGFFCFPIKVCLGPYHGVVFLDSKELNDCGVVVKNILQNKVKNKIKSIKRNVVKEIRGI